MINVLEINFEILKLQKQYTLKKTNVYITEKALSRASLHKVAVLVEGHYNIRSD